MMFSLDFASLNAEGDVLLCDTAISACDMPSVPFLQLLARIDDLAYAIVREREKSWSRFHARAPCDLVASEIMWANQCEY